MTAGNPSRGPRPSPVPAPGPRPGPAVPDPGGPDRLAAAVDAELARLDDQDVVAQVETYHRLHTVLTDALTRTTDSGPPRPGP